MKARTKLQFRVVGLSNQLPDLTSKLEPWAKKECLDHKGFATKNRVICLDCGKHFSPELVARTWARCPHCQTRITITASKKRTDKQVTYYAITTVIEEFQVVRFFEMYAYYKGGKPATYWSHEVMQHWIIPDGKREVIGLNHHLSWNTDSWSGKWEIRDRSNLNRYDVYPYKYHPSSQIMRAYKKYGITSKLSGLTFLQAIRKVPFDSVAETLLKAKRYDFLRLMDSIRYAVHRHWPTIKVCMRNKYKPKDMSIYFDYLDLLQYFRKDLHNAKYVCPKNLKEEHDRLMRNKRDRERKEATERKRQKIAEAQKTFAKKIKKFLGLQFSDGTITVKLLETVKEFEIEGDTLKHCVFVNDYFGKQDSLILSARINDVPIETVEVSLSKMKIVQSRGLRNAATEHNKKIVALVNKNLKLIKKMNLQETA